MPYAHITGWGMAVPDKVLTNDDLSKMVDTNDKWIREMTGIRERRIAADGETASSLGTNAAFNALKMAGLLPTDLDLIICSTSSPDYIFPATACIIQDNLGASNAGAFDLLAACSGFIYALNIAAQAIRSGSSKTVLVVGAEALSRFVNWEDRNTCILFGDGAGAFVLQASEKPGGIRGGVMHSDGSGGEYLAIPASGSAHPATDITIHTAQHFIQMNGKEVFRFATRVMTQATIEAVQKSGWKVEDLNLLIPHQANLRIIDAAARGLKMPMEKIMVNIDCYGNTSTASIPIATVEAVQKGKLHPGDKVVFVGFGAGLTWGALAAEWSGPLPPQHYSYITADLYKPWARVRSAFRRALRILEGMFFGRNGKA
jgi:3-oxoacyl-[acyl-carrier-protein] synthase III